jgi:hypothetical protein
MAYGVILTKQILLESGNEIGFLEIRRGMIWLRGYE